MRTPGDHVIVVFGATGDLAGVRSSRGFTTSTVPALSRWAIAAPMPRVASVKWLAEIELAARAFGGYFQANRYHIGGQLLTSQAVRSLITWPQTGNTLAPGQAMVRGLAWSQSRHPRQSGWPAGSADARSAGRRRPAWSLLRSGLGHAVGELGARGDLKFLERVGEVGLDGAQCDVELLSDLPGCAQTTS